MVHAAARKASSVRVSHWKIVVQALAIAGVQRRIVSPVARVNLVRAPGAVKHHPTGPVVGMNSYTCDESSYGNCCSSSGYCGSGTAHCASGYQATFSTCSSGSTKISIDGSCGTRNHLTCNNSSFKKSCSGAGYRGHTADHCSTGCQSSFGGCTTSDITQRSVSPDGTC